MTFCITLEPNLTLELYMTKIISVESELFRLTLNKISVDTKHGEDSHFELIIKLIKVDNGLNGTGSTYTEVYGRHAIKALIDNAIKPFILSKNCSKIEETNEQLC